VVALHAFDQFIDRLRLVALRVEIGSDFQADAAFGFFWPRRTMRRPGRCGEFGAAFAQQTLERLLARGAAEPAGLRRQVGARAAVLRLIAETKLFRQVGTEPRHPPPLPLPFRPLLAFL